MTAMTTATHPRRVHPNEKDHHDDPKPVILEKFHKHLLRFSTYSSNPASL
jgi:hypothetical protein